MKLVFHSLDAAAAAADVACMLLCERDAHMFILYVLHISWSLSLSLPFVHAITVEHHIASAACLWPPKSNSEAHQHRRSAGRMNNM